LLVVEESDFHFAIIMEGRRYANEEYVDMIKLLGVCNDNARSAARLYRERYPNRRHPDHKTIRAVEIRLLENGCFAPRKDNSGRPRRLTWQQEEQLLNDIDQEPLTSVRILERDHQHPRSTVHRFMQRANLYPYHLQPVQCLHPGDSELRLEFCRVVLNTLEMNQNYFEQVLFSDESHFNQEGVFNHHNLHNWNYENPYETRETRRQVRWSVNVWIGQLGNRIIGPHFFPRVLNGETYANFLENALPVLLEEIPLAQRRNILYQHDGAPAHYSRIVRDILNLQFPNRWIGRGGPTAWPPRSPDLNPIDFWVWGYLKNAVYSTVPTNEDDVVVRIYGALADITNATFNSVKNNFIRRLQACIQQNGEHFEQIPF
jgi:hypothetical protein